MKILRKFLFVCLFSCLFLIGNANALSYSDYSSTVTYSDKTEQLKVEKQEKIDLIINYLKNNGFYVGENHYNLENKYVIMINLDSFDQALVIVRLIDLSNLSNSFIQNYYGDSWRNRRLLYQYYGHNLNFTINSDNSVIENVSTSSTNTFPFSVSYGSLNPTIENVNLQINNFYFFTDLVSSEYLTKTIPFNTYGNESFIEIPLKINENIFKQPTSIYLINFLKSFSKDYIPPKTCISKEIGYIKNISSFTLEVNGVSNALSEPLKGQFGIVGSGSNPLLLTNDYNIQVKEKNNKKITGKYEFQCNEEDIGNGCELKYEYISTEDIDTTLNLQFIFTSKTNSLDYSYHLYGCNFNNSSMSYTYVNKLNDNIVDNPSLENSINDDNVNGSNEFLNDNIINNNAFKQDDGLIQIIQAPINFLNSLNSKTCKNIVLPLPNLGDASIPCMSEIYKKNFNEIYSVVKLFINGLLCYRMALSVVMIIKSSKNPNEDRIEVLDL